MRISILISLLCCFQISTSIGQTPEQLKVEASNFLNTLNDEASAAILYPLEDSARTNWTNLPVGLQSRPGVQYGNLTDNSRRAFHNFLTSVLSSQGYLKVNSIMQLDDILNLLVEDRYQAGDINEGQRNRLLGFKWGYNEYYVSIFGDPRTESIWSIKFEGHHLSLNLTMNESSISCTPLFMGSDPSEVTFGKYAGIRVLSKEEDYGFMLLHSLNPDQKEVAVLSEEVPRDIITNPYSNQRIDSYSGIQAKDFSENQLAFLDLLIREYTHNFKHDLAHTLYDQIISTGLDQVYFAWIGSHQRGKPHYYIIHGPDFLIEYDNYPRSGNHIHLILREKDNDFGEDLLKNHYLNSEHHKKD